MAAHVVDGAAPVRVSSAASSADAQAWRRRRDRRATIIGGAAPRTASSSRSLSVEAPASTTTRLYRAVVQDVRAARRRRARIDRHVRGACLQGAVDRRHRVDRLAQVEADPVAAVDAQRGSRSRTRSDRASSSPYVIDPLPGSTTAARRVRAPRERDEILVQARSMRHHCAPCGFLGLEQPHDLARSCRGSPGPTSCASKLMPKCSSRNMTSLSVAIESRMPPLMSGVVVGQLVRDPRREGTPSG